MHRLYEITSKSYKGVPLMSQNGKWGLPTRRVTVRSPTIAYWPRAESHWGSNVQMPACLQAVSITTSLSISQFPVYAILGQLVNHLFCNDILNVYFFVLYCWLYFSTVHVNYMYIGSDYNALYFLWKTCWE